ncbi:hypothetical protein B0H10DRAFT_1938235 [Mycena sp. CBHHK59/15]|nr:hypothetical protein B0H10DRAFT_1938235 [Mycena sp. CBHHK59/15]
MRATVSIYEDPHPKSGADVWGSEGGSTTTLYVVAVLSLAAATTLGYFVYQFSGLAKSGRLFGGLIQGAGRGKAQGQDEGTRMAVHLENTCDGKIRSRSQRDRARPIGL